MALLQEHGFEVLFALSTAVSVPALLLAFALSLSQVFACVYDACATHGTVWLATAFASWLSGGACGALRCVWPKIQL